MAFDAHANFAYSTVLTAPSPATSGTTVVVQSGDGAKFPAAPFNMAIWPAGAQPLTSNAEIVRCTAKSTDTLTITRTQESTSARTVVVGDQIAAVLTSKSLTDIETAVPPDYTVPTGYSYQTVKRSASVGTSQAMTSGTLILVGIELPIGFVVGHIAFGYSTAGSVQSHRWHGLYDSSRVQLAMSADQLTTLPTATAINSLAVASTAAGVASTFTTTYTGLHYVGIMMAGSTVPTLIAAYSAANAVMVASPAFFGSSDTAQTTVPGYPHTAGAITNLAAIPWAAVGA